MEDDLKKIITEYAVLAPSGENCQPWRFVISGNKIDVFNIPERDQSVYNYNQKGSYVAHGALIENIVIASTAFNYGVSVHLFPEKYSVDLIASIFFEKKNTGKDDLFDYIKTRHTNRRVYKTKKLTLEQKKQLDSLSNLGFGSVVVLDNDSELGVLSGALAVNEKVIFENKKLHDFFYNHVLWKKEDEVRSGGFYYKTLEFLPHQLKAVKILKFWPALIILNKLFGVAEKIAKENAEKYAKSAAMVGILSSSNDKQGYVNAGRLAERVWLTATKMGLSVHPCTGVLYFMENILNGNEAIFSREHRNVIEVAYSKIKSLFLLGERKMPMLVRVGFAEGEATARSLRISPKIEIKSQ